MLKVWIRMVFQAYFEMVCVLVEEPPLLVLYLIDRFIYLQSLMDYTLLED